MNNFDEIKKVNCIIQYAKQLKIYNQSPADFVKEERGIYSSFPSKWEDLFNLKISKSNIDLLYYLLSTRAKEVSLKKETAINEMKKLKKFKFNESKINKNIGFYIDHLKEIKKIDEILIMAFNVEDIKYKTPLTIYKKNYEVDCNLSFPKDWNDLFKLEWSTFKLNELYISTKIERIKYYLSKYKLESYLDYSFYDKSINPKNCCVYEEDFEKYFDNYKRLKKLRDKIDFIECYIDEFYSGNDKKTVKDDIEYLKGKDLNAKTDLNSFKIYEDKFERIYNQIKTKKDEYLKEKKRIRKEEERRERERENRNYSSNCKSNYSSSSSSSTNLDLKKSYVKLCRYCKNNCVCCKRVIKGGELHTGKAFGLHNKCQIDSCFICGTSKRSDDIRERQTSYLCKSCYNSLKQLDWTKCISCHKIFK